MRPLSLTLWTFLIAGLAAAAQVLAAPAACDARSGLVVPTVIELYTSEGCNSCPPADRWLAGLKGRDDLVRLAFHVDYWDQLGWKDRFADPAYTRRQQAWVARGAAPFAYTPQVVVDGADYRGWPALPRGARRAATVQLALSQDGGAYVARVQRGPGAPMRLAAFWVVTEDGHVTQVRAGENGGATLRHDAVVRELYEVAAVGDGPLRFVPRAQPEPWPGRRVQLVVTDGETGKPVQAVGC